MTRNARSRRTLCCAALAGSAALLGGMYAFSQLSGKATPEEQAWRYPGDDLIDANYDNGYSSTYAITIDAPAYAVWRLFKQIGAEKSGSFSSEFLERVFARLPFFNSYEIQEEFQQPDSMMPGDIAAFDFHGMSMGVGGRRTPASTWSSGSTRKTRPRPPDPTRSASPACRTSPPPGASTWCPYRANARASSTTGASATNPASPAMKA